MDAFEAKPDRPGIASIRWCGDVRAVLGDGPFDEESVADKAKATSVPDAAAA